VNDRLYIAAQALQGLLAAGAPPVSAPEIAVDCADALLVKLARVSPPVPAAEAPTPLGDDGGSAAGGLICCWGSCERPGIIDRDTAAPFCVEVHIGAMLHARRAWADRYGERRTPPKEAARRAGELAEKFGGGS